MTGKPQIFIAAPAFGMTFTGGTTASLVNLAARLAAERILNGFATLTFPDIAELRNMFLSIWYDKVGTSHILFIDHDMSFRPELVMDMLAFDKPVVGTLYAKKTFPIQCVGSALEGEQIMEGGFIKLEGVGFGVTLIRRDCIDAMIAKFPEIIDTQLERHTAGQMLKDQGLSRLIRAFDPILSEERRLSEDFSFCKRHRDSGGDVWAATHHEVIHIGQYGFKGEFGGIIPNGEKP